MAQGLSAEEALAACETERLVAVVGRERARLAEFYDDGFIDLAASGERLGKEQLIEVLLALPPGRRYEQQDRVFQLRGEAAVVTGVLVGWEGERVVLSARFLHVWHREAGRWRMVAGMSAPLERSASR